MGYDAIPWDYMERYVNAYTGLLRGETIEWGEPGCACCTHTDPPRPVTIPVLVGALGPKGRQVAHRVGQGVYATSQIDPAIREFPWVAYLYFGSIWDDDETPSDEWQRATAGPGWALVYHLVYEHAGPEAVEAMPGGDDWLTIINKNPPERAASRRPRRSPH
jgi:5,10-methylenetetrahydromethanopterin reductase